MNSILLCGGCGASVAQVRGWLEMRLEGNLAGPRLVFQGLNKLEK